VPTVEQRRFHRYDVRSSVEVAGPGWRGTFETLDVGAGGCRIAVDRAIEKGTEVTVKLRSERSSTCPHGQAKVAWANHAAPYAVGIAFSDELAEQVIGFLQDLLGPVPIHIDP
jgi:hypothetical protein